MKWENLFKVAFKSILKNKMRTFLTMLGIIIGVGAVIVMVAIGEGAQKRIQNQITSMGTNLLMVFPGASRVGGAFMSAGSGAMLSVKDVEALSREVTELVALSPVIRTGAQVIGAAGNWNTSVYGVSESYLVIRDWKLEEGEFFKASDIRASNKVCVIGKTVATNIFKGEDAIGQTIRIRNVPFRVIGLLAEKGQSSFGQDQDDVIMAPYTSVMYRLSGFQFRGIQQIVLRISDLDKMNKVQEEVRKVLRETHRLQEGEDDDFNIRNQSEFIAMAQESSQTLTILLAAIASVSLIVGGIGIMNIMLVSVTERTREIGIRMAVGAKRRDIMTQFLIEAIVLSVFGGLIGILLGFGASFLLGKITGWLVVIRVDTVLLSFSFAALIGVFFGYYPALKASLLNPIEALRYE